MSIEVSLYESDGLGGEPSIVDKMVLKGTPRQGETIYVHRKGSDESVWAYKVKSVAYIPQKDMCLVSVETPIYCKEEWSDFLKGIIYEG